MNTRDRILDAAAELMRTRGIIRTTTKEIAKAAGFSEATLYKHFRDKEELLLRVLRERMPALARHRGLLPRRAAPGPRHRRHRRVRRGGAARGGCFQQAFLRYFTMGAEATPAPDAMAAALARTLVRAIVPHSES